MQIDKNQIIELIKSHSGQDKADQAASELPDQVDTDQHQNLLEKFGINPSELLGGMGDKLGGLGGKLGL